VGGDRLINMGNGSIGVVQIKGCGGFIKTVGGERLERIYSLGSLMLGSINSHVTKRSLEKRSVLGGFKYHEEC